MPPPPDDEDIGDGEGAASAEKMAAAAARAEGALMKETTVGEWGEMAINDLLPVLKRSKHAAEKALFEVVQKRFHQNQIGRVQQVGDSRTYESRAAFRTRILSTPVRARTLPRHLYSPRCTTRRCSRRQTDSA